MCRNPFIEADGYCTACGKKHSASKKRQNVPSYANVKPVEKPAMNEPTENDMTDTAVAMIEALSEVFGIEVKITVKDVMKIAARSKQITDKRIAHEIVIGTKGLAHVAANGVDEYEAPRLKCRVNAIKMRNTTAIQYAMKHEFAHVLAIETYGFVNGYGHGDVFANQLAKVLRFAP